MGPASLFPRMNFASGSRRVTLRAAAAVQTRALPLAPSLLPFLLCLHWRFLCHGHCRRRIQSSCSPWQRLVRLIAAARTEGDRLRPWRRNDIPLLDDELIKRINLRYGGNRRASLTL